MSHEKAAELVRRCFDARTAAHEYHLSTRSYAEHKALNDFYDGIVDLVDTFAETYQGLHGALLPMSDLPYNRGSGPRPMLIALLKWIETERTAVCPRSDTALQNIIDEIVALIGQTMYKLRFLS